MGVAQQTPLGAREAGKRGSVAARGGGKVAGGGIGGSGLGGGLGGLGGYNKKKKFRMEEHMARQHKLHRDLQQQRRKDLKLYQHVPLQGCSKTKLLGLRAMQRQQHVMQARPRLHEQGQPQEQQQEQQQQQQEQQQQQQQQPWGRRCRVDVDVDADTDEIREFKETRHDECDEAFDKDLHTHLAMLRHAMGCSQTSEQCPEWSCCAWVKDLFEHMLQCRLRHDHAQCRDPNCRSMRRALRHYYSCHSSGCKTCSLLISSTSPTKAMQHGP